MATDIVHIEHNHFCHALCLNPIVDDIFDGPGIAHGSLEANNANGGTLTLRKRDSERRRLRTITLRVSRNRICDHEHTLCISCARALCDETRVLRIDDKARELALNARGGHKGFRHDTLAAASINETKSPSKLCATSHIENRISRRGNDLE